MKQRFLLFILTSVITFTAVGQSEQKKMDVYVDASGVMRWGHDDAEVKGFGVNYSVPFAHAYRTAEKLDIDLKEAIDRDVYHFSRLDFDLYRIHVWDTEISDAEGNLLQNEHLEMFDYLLKKLKERGINFMITPIAYWGNGWPEPDEDTPGFSNKYGKEGSLTSPEAIKAQENYLFQFMNHVNPYTGIAYKDEPNIIAFEISNEPHHKGTPEEVTTFINKMVASMRKAGTEKPIFYNVSHSVHLADAYFKADIDGGTFQWYPTGLGFQKELEGNLLPNVNEYTIPFDSVLTENMAAKLVYEFDAADVNKSYMYPAMARSFREAGIQIATHFAYDPTYMAFANTEYNTHYMNLAYTPQKALALMVSGKIFHEIPMNQDLGTYPENLHFGDFLISYEDDLGAYNTEEEFIYTNSNSLSPKDPEKLSKIAGYGNSELVQYEGKGAYFLDKLEEGTWRLEVMPDAIIVENVFGSNSLDKTVAVINWAEREMKLQLPGIGEGFQLKPINENNGFAPKVEGTSFKIKPGTYLLTKKGESTALTGKEAWESGHLNDFSAPDSTVEKTWLVHDPIDVSTAESSFKISAEIVSDEDIEKVEVWFRNGNHYGNKELEHRSAYTFSGEVPKDLLIPGYLNYQIIVTTASQTFTFPAGAEGNPGEWDFHNEDSYSTKIVETESSLVLFEAMEDEDHIVGKWVEGLHLKPGDVSCEAEYQVKLESLFEVDVENKNADPIYDYSFRFNFLDKIQGRRKELDSYKQLIIKARSLSGKVEKLQVAVVDENGSSFGKTIELGPEIKEYKIDLSDLKPVRTVTLPRPYPTFLPYYFDHNNEGGLELQTMESLQFSIGPGMSEEEKKKPHAVGITSVRLER